jgi:uncharacterized membrane protein YcaP (DUF421 family)
MELWRIAIRAITAYVYLLVMTRASGKRVVREATPFDFVVALIVGDMIDDALWAEVSIAKFAAGVGALFVCDVVTKLLAYHSPAFSRVVCGTPTRVLQDGVDDHDGLRAEQLNEGELETLLRLQGIGDRKDVKIARLEEDGELSPIKYPEARPATKADAPRVKEMLKWSAS